MELNTLYSLVLWGALPSLPFQRWKCHSSYLGKRTHTPPGSVGTLPQGKVDIYFSPPADHNSSSERISSMWIHSAMRTAFLHSLGFFPDSILNSFRSTPYLSRDC